MISEIINLLNKNGIYVMSNDVEVFVDVYGGVIYLGGSPETAKIAVDKKLLSEKVWKQIVALWLKAL